MTEAGGHTRRPPQPNVKDPPGRNPDGPEQELPTEGYDMSHPIPEDAQRLADRLRMAADEILSAARYGVPIPRGILVSGHEFGEVAFSARDRAEFDAWAEYTEATVEHSHHHGSDWSATEVDVNGLPLSFAFRHDAEQVTA